MTDTLGWLSDSPGVSSQCQLGIKTKTHKDITHPKCCCWRVRTPERRRQLLVSENLTWTQPHPPAQEAAPRRDKGETGETRDKSCVQKLLSYRQRLFEISKKKYILLSEFRFKRNCWFAQCSPTVSESHVLS